MGDSSMTPEGKNNEGSYSRDFIKANFGVIATLLSFAFIVLQLFMISEKDYPTTLFLLAHSEKIPLLVGIMLPLLAPLFMFTTWVFFRIYFVANFKGRKLHDQVIFFLAIISAFLAVEMGNWQTWLLVSGLSYFILDIHFPAWLFTRKGRAGWRLKPPEEKHVFYRDDIAWSPGSYVAIIAMVALYSSGNSWLPSECVTLTNGNRISAFVLSIDVRNTYLMDLPGRHPLVLKSDEIEDRQVDPTNSEVACKKLTKKDSRITPGAPIVSPTPSTVP